MKKTLIFLSMIVCSTATSCGLMQSVPQETGQEQNAEQQDVKVRQELIDPLPGYVNKSPAKDTTVIEIMDSAPSTNVVKPKPPTFGK